MNPKSTLMKRRRNVLAVLCALAIGPGEPLAYVASARPAIPQASTSQDTASHIPADQLDSLVAPIALYPDPLLAQTLAASTYPLEIMQLQQWLTRNAGLKDKALADAAAQQPWDPSIQALAVLPEVVNRLANDIQWTTDLGNAFLGHQADVMEAIQRMRGKAQDKGNLKSSAQQVVETEVVENESVIVIEQATPEIVYVPSYDPVMVYGPPVYPYPPIYYPPAGYYAAGMAVSFGAGVAMGAFWGNGGGWGWGPRWGDNDITINNNNNFVRNANVRSGYRGGTVNNTWQHRPEHRGGAPYRDRTTANKYGGTARGDSLTQRQTSARQEINRQGGNLPSNRVGTSGTSGRTAGAQPGQIGDNVGNRSSAAGLESRTPRSSPSSRPGSADVSSRATGSGADRIGERDVSRSSGGDRNAFGGGHQTYNGSSARADSHRGSSSVRSGGGGASRSGGGRSHGGGGRSHGGGGRRR